MHTTILKGNLGHDQLILICQIQTSSCWCLVFTEMKLIFGRGKIKTATTAKKTFH